MRLQLLLLLASSLTSCTHDATVPDSGAAPLQTTTATNTGHIFASTMHGPKGQDTLTLCRGLDFLVRKDDPKIHTQVEEVDHVLVQNNVSPGGACFVRDCHLDRGRETCITQGNTDVYNQYLGEAKDAAHGDAKGTSAAAALAMPFGADAYSYSQETAANGARRETYCRGINVNAATTGKDALVTPEALEAAVTAQLTPKGQCFRKSCDAKGRHCKKTGNGKVEKDYRGARK